MAYLLKPHFCNKRYYNFMKKLIFIFLLCLPQFHIQAQNKVELEPLLFQKIPIRNGKKLSADIYKPAKMDKPLPAILVLTPYLSNEKVKRAMYFAQRGYVFVTADCRGRRQSDGVFTPFENDGQDGHDVVEWVAKQPWCNGKVGMMGGSYRGMVQWMILKNFPPHLKSIVPTASVGPGIDFPKGNGIFNKYAAQWLAMVNGRSQNDAIFEAYQYWRNKSKSFLKKHLPFVEYAKYTASNDRVFRKWVAHPDFDEYWQSFYPTPKDYKKINIPVLTITGHYDGDQAGALHYYSQHMKHGNATAKNKHYLVIGPWTHGGTRKPNKKWRYLTFGKNSLIDMNKLHLDWFDWTLKGKEKSKPELLKDKVTYYETVTNKWRHQSVFKEYSDKNLVYYLSSKDGQANYTSHPAWLNKNKPAKKEKPDSFVYNPLEQPTDTEHKASGKQNLVIYRSVPFVGDVVLSGRIKANLYLEIDTPDTDFGWAVYEVLSDGKANYLKGGVMRARYRKSLEKAELVKPGKVNLYTLDKSQYFSKKIKKGSSIQLYVYPANNSYKQRNYNSGKDVSKETAKDAKTCTVKVHHSAKYPSHLVLPIDTNKK